MTKFTAHLVDGSSLDIDITLKDRSTIGAEHVMSFAKNVGYLTGMLPPDKAIAIPFHSILWICPQ